MTKRLKSSELTLEELEVRRRKAREYMKRWRAENRRRWNDICRRSATRTGLSRKYYAANRQKLLALNAEWRSNNKALIVASKKRRLPEIVRAEEALRRARKSNALPKWLSREHKKEIVAVYKEARRLTCLTGIPFHVDHILPLAGINVCGLHVPWNLQVLPGYENMSKHNKCLL